MSKSKRSHPTRPQSGVAIQDEFDEALLAADRLVQEYLAFRGFTETLVRFESERSGDKKYTFNAKAIVKHMFRLVANHDSSALMTLWSFLENRFFRTLRDEELLKIASTKKNNLFKHFISTCIRDNRKEIALKFLKEQCADTSSSWREWFALPFMDEPEKDSRLGIYFEEYVFFFVFPNSNSHLIKIHTTPRSWIKHFHDSLVNFLASLFRRLPLPHIMNFRVAYAVFYVNQNNSNTHNSNNTQIH